MKLMIASDIHGSEYYCRLLLEKFQKEQADKLILLGDILYHGPRNELPRDYNPKNVIELLNNISDRILCVRGNCDCDVDQMVLDFPIMAEYAIIYLENRLVYMTHGHRLEENRLTLLKQGDILLLGHTHVPACDKSEPYIYMNPGSVSIPKENSAHSYMLLDGNNFIWKNLIDGSEYMSYKI
ncbi:MAG: phosphodiesterase [Clostridiales bacterium]|nr:phosphodiesterase [Clostridiales bacterium]